MKPESEFFDLNTINRGWKRVFGVQIFHGFGGLSTTGSGEEGQPLVDRLIETLHAVDYDYGRFLQVLMTSRIAQLESVPFEPNWTAWNEWVLTGPMARKLTVDERDRSLTILETGRTDPELDGVMKAKSFSPEAAWLTSADIERKVSGNPLAAFWSEIEKAESDTEALERVFLAAVARVPSEAELTELLKLIGNESEPRKVRMSRALWALLMSEEFAWVP